MEVARPRQIDGEERKSEIKEASESEIHRGIEGGEEREEIKKGG